MSRTDLSSNNFSGRVPSSFGDLDHLLTLNLSKNHLDGPIPAEFENLRHIQILDMSSNNLSGNVQQEFSQLQNLTCLILTNNSFHGEVPSKLTNFSRQDNQDLSDTFFSGRVLPNKNFSRFAGESFSVKYVLNPLPCGNWSESCLGPQIEDPIEESTGLPRSRVLLITFSCIAL